MKQNWIPVLLQYLGALLMAYLGVVLVRSLGLSGVPLALLSVPAALLLSPHLRQKMRSTLKWPWFPGTGTSIVLAIVVLALQISVGGDIQASAEEKARSAAAQAAKERIAAAREAKATEFAKDGEKILAQMEEMIAQGRAHDALNLGRPYLPVTNNPRLPELVHKADIAAMKAELKEKSNIEPERQLEIYTALSKESPSDRNLQKKAAEAKRFVDELKLVKQAQEELARHKENVKKQFDAWNGSHPTAVKAVKALMHNPDSFEHVETRYTLPTKNTTLIMMTYRGTNAFGAVVTNVAKVRLNAEGGLIGLE